jgi:hypothetical protein
MTNVQIILLSRDGLDVVFFFDVQGPAAPPPLRPLRIERERKKEEEFTTIKNEKRSNKFCLFNSIAIQPIPFPPLSPPLSLSSRSA